MSKAQMIREARNKIKRDYITLCLIDYDDLSILDDDNIDMYVERAEEVLLRSHLYLDIENVAFVIMRDGASTSVGDLVQSASEILKIMVDS